MSHDKRIQWIDIAKGISIILVVLGHSGEFIGNHFLAWFRMPLFFFLSGLLFKPIDRSIFIKWAANKTTRMLIPYFSFGILILIIFGYPDYYNLSTKITNLMYGGIKLTGEYGVFWFITCLLLTQIMFGFLSAYSVRTQIIVISVSYVLAHFISATSLKEVAIPWNADVVLLTLTYYSLGYYLKQWILNNVNNLKLLFIFIIIVFIFVYLDFDSVISYKLDLKYKEYHNILLDFIIPISFFLPICAISYQLTKYRLSKVLSWLGKNTITIMYLHIPVNLLVKEAFSVDYGFVLFTIVGTVFPLLLGLLFRQSKTLTFLFLNSNLQRFLIK
ncbi:fucose 4-O-acetylase-like acetyltransferase [Gracilibacillus halotolerans]|uniref:Fucose 4-O-acetylase-like acetyltransferase n=1 Tax=Gracilibacillus halotolerans TaxID=74386 RepID=A0A841RS44_9BACI|nr:acyltransferase family protein [Gracilibacillus halotolerans]MBB6514025.1 fucose 4-O-acetylase-like acetyltransferase [Gracilibacillus halotolerans]